MVQTTTCDLHNETIVKLQRELERLQAENAKLRKALQDFYDYGYDRSECKLVLDPKETDK